MNKYVILTPQIGNMGGGQMFACNKAEYMANLGWDVVICYFTESPILIQKVLKFNRIYCPQISWGVQYYTKNKVKSIVNGITKQINTAPDDEIIVESHLCYLSLWGELVAEKLHAKHIINSFEEDIPQFSSKEISFFEYKLKRWECVNASEKSLKRLFKSYFKDEYNSFSHPTTFYCSNVSTDNVFYSDVNVPDSNSFNILSVGRLNKPYVQEMITEMYRFAVKNSNTNIGLVFIGASPDGSVEKKIMSTFDGLENVKIYLLGYMFPIPLNVIKCANIAIGTSNAVLVTHDQGIPTIAVDAQDCFAIGVYGINTDRKVFRKEEPQTPISFYIEKLFKGELMNNMSSLNNIVVEDHFIDQVEFLNKSTKDDKYYNVYKIHSFLEVMIGVLKKVVSSTLKKIQFR